MGTLEQLIRPGVERAVDRAIHEDDPERFHRRVQGGLCPLCLSLSERITEMFRKSVPGSEMSERAKATLERVMDLQDARYPE